MAETLVARVSLNINAPRAKVWDGLLEFDQSRPIFRASQAVRPSDYHRVTIELSYDGAQTHLTLIEQGNTTDVELAHSQGGWQLALGNLKALLEGTSVVPMR
jgi:uncharacterized protein YndB with AHSA1/START domain